MFCRNAVQVGLQFELYAVGFLIAVLLYGINNNFLSNDSLEFVKLKFKTNLSINSYRKNRQKINF
jgi:hypothetical protein